MGEVPFVFGGVRDCFQLVVYLFSEHAAAVPLPQLLGDVHPVDGPALVLELHQQVRVVVYFLGMEMDVGRLIHLEVLVYFLG